jgi:uncharacterized protein YkwD
MFKFFRKVFLILILIGLIFAWVKLKNESKNINAKNIIQQGSNLLEPVGGLLLKGIKDTLDFGEQTDSSYNKDVDNYKLESLKNSSNSAKEIGAIKQEFGGTEDIIITLINKERFDVGLEPLEKSKRLMKSALAKAEDMKRDQYFEHVSVQKIQPWFFVEEAGYRYEKFGENIAFDYLSANSVHKAFMDSNGHKANILDKNFKDIGVAIFSVETKEGQKYIIVEHFGETLKKIDIKKREKYSDKSKRYCNIQKDKKKELKKMIKNQKKVIEEFEEEINKQAIEDAEARLMSLENIKKKINGYLDDCKILEKKYKKKS